jgi:hypothetical protein
MRRPRKKLFNQSEKTQKLGSLFSYAYFSGQLKRWVRKSWWNRLVAGFLAVFFVIVTLTYSVAQWYIYTNRNRPIVLGTTFVPNYARYFGLDPKETMTAMVDDLGFKRLRLVSYWSNLEKKRGVYDFSELDWQFKIAEQRGVTVTLSVGLRQPRWPECHIPKWANSLPKSEWYPELKKFMAATVERYKNSPVLESYQLENEFLLTVFGECPDHDRDRLVEEFDYLRSLDSKHPIIVTRSNNATPSWPVGSPRADQVGAAVYKRVWDKTLSKRYFEYPLPAWYYAFLAGGTKLTTGRESILHELQAEPWLPDGYNLRTASVEEQNFTMDAERLHHRFEYGRATGMKTIDLWGVEWWYYRKTRGDDSLWQAAKQEIQKTNDLNARL